MSSDAALPSAEPPQPKEEDSFVIETDTHAFVVKLWLEEENAPRTWRGHVTHVVTGERKHVNDTSQIVNFIDRYL